MAEDQSVCETEINIDGDVEHEVPKIAKREFSQGDDQVLWMAFEEHGLTEEVSTLVSYLVKGTVSEIQERYKHLKEKSMRELNQHSGENESPFGICLDGSSSAALDTFDKPFCRQCFVFGCTMHGCSQPVIYPCEKQLVWSKPEVDRTPCSDQCYLKGTQNVIVDEEGGILEPSTIMKSGDQRISDGTCASSKSFAEHASSSKSIVSGSTCHGEHEKDFSHQQKDIPKEMEFEGLSNLVDMPIDGMLSISDWKPLEKELYLKGIEIFGRKSCLISRNLLAGLKTCMEVASYMDAEQVSMDHDMGKNVESTDQKTPSTRSRRKGKPKKVSTGKKNYFIHINKQYKPCGCQGVCGKECPCHQIGNSCEKYCGCSKNCKYLFRGCVCPKSQCRTRHCPCFAADRECDPDVCKHCWVSCGDGSLGEPPRCGDAHCENMNILLGKKERILWGKSVIAGWGAFIKNPVDKNCFLGEYTGEVLTHSKSFSLAISTYLFNINDQYVVDAFRKGNKLKFANHSSKPNCYCKVLFVAGDHRIGIFAEGRIEAGEEIFYNYNYDPSVSPAWALKTSGSNRYQSKGSRGRPKKHASNR